MNRALVKIQELGIFVSTQKAATMVGRDVTWVQKNKRKFVFKRKNGRRNLEFELTSVLRVWDKMYKDEQAKLQSRQRA